MKKFLLLSLLALPVLAQDQWTTTTRYAVFATYATETGPPNVENKFFSTNWFEAGTRHTIGERGLVIFRGRASLEPFTIPREGTPQLLQWVSPQSGGPLVDRMRAHRLIDEAAADVQFRIVGAASARLYLAPVGNPPLGPVPYAQRASSIDFAEAPFAYDVQEGFHEATRVATIGVTSPTFGLEGGVFHRAISTGRHTSVGDGKIDSWSARATVTPSANWSLPVSHGKLGDEDTKITSASTTFTVGRGAASVLWTKRDSESAIGAEGIFNVARSAFLARVEAVDRPPGFPAGDRRTTHVTVGYLFNFPRGIALGVNGDYHTQTRELKTQYGHKPQSVYVYLRFR